MSSSRALRLHQRDNVAIAIDDLASSTRLEDLNVTAKDRVPRGHKIALTAIASGAYVVKFGQIIGVAMRDIQPGEHLHTHNLAMAEFERDYGFGVDAVPTNFVAEAERAVFQGYRRPDGKAGTRNYVGIVTSVNCSASVARQLARAAEKSGLLEKYQNVDGIVPIVHGAGCCIGTDDEAFAKLQRTIWGYARHPNFASVMMLGLGCEANQIPLMLEVYGTPPREQFRYSTLQAEGGTRKTLEKGLLWLEEMLDYANQQKRVTIPASELTIALQCGGSDGYSGISANPALGVAADLLVQHGGTVALGETPEIYGAEHLLTRRAASVDVGEKLIGLIRWWEDYAAKHGSSMNNNPTPGNKAGGLTTILEKSLGAAAKGGSTNLTGVYRYGEAITAKGFVFVDSPGYDPVSITGQVASGCNMVVFTTGRGSCYGNKPAPSMKLATNTPMYNHMIDDMDINCGTIIDGAETVEEAGARIFDTMLKVASGERTKSELLDIGEAEFAPWQTYAQM